jgi:ribosomal protein S10
MKNQVDITFKSFESESLKKAIEKADKITQMYSLKGNTRSFWLKKKIQRWTLLRSPHVHKKSREQFEMVTNKAVLQTSWQKETDIKNFLIALKNIEIYGVQVSIKVSSSMYFDLLKKNTN